MVWETSVNPCSAATSSAHTSAAPPSTSGAAADPAHQVMVVMVRAAAVDGLAGVGAQGVDLACGGHRLQGAVHGGQPDALTLLTQFIV
jgi:hypothetical protein